jgi:hypothetical protein
MKIKVVYVITEAPYYNDGRYPIAVATSKKKAFALCRANGFKWNKQEKIFLNEAKHLYRDLIPLPLDKIINDDITTQTEEEREEYDYFVEKYF